MRSPRLTLALMTVVSCPAPEMVRFLPYIQITKLVIKMFQEVRVGI